MLIYLRVELITFLKAKWLSSKMKIPPSRSWCLWNTSHLTYKNEQARGAAVVKIVESMGLYGFQSTGVKK